MAQLQSTGITGSISMKSIDGDGFKNKLIGECNSIYAAGVGPQCHIAIGECVYPDASFGICGNLTITSGGSGYGTPSTTTRPCATITTTDDGVAAYAYVQSYNNAITYIPICTPGYRYSGDPACTTVTITGGTGTGATAEVSTFTTASRNIGIGYNIGEHAGGYMCNNIAIGECILNITGSNGVDGSALTYVDCNIYIGKNLAIGCNSSYFYGCERFNTYIGREMNCRIGCTADTYLSCLNVGIGNCNFLRMNCGFCNVAIGCGNLAGLGTNTYSGRVGYRNVAIGMQALRNPYSNIENIAIGSCALYGNNSANNTLYNIAIGRAALQCICTGDYNIAIGLGAGFRTDGNSRMIAIGTYAGYCNCNVGGNSNDNLYIGDYAGYRTCTSDANTVVGQFAFCALGQNACRNQIFGYAAATCLGCNSIYNTIMGHGAGFHLRCESANNIYIGSFSGYSSTAIDGNANNIVIGYYAGRNYAGDGNIVIGCGMCQSSCTAISECFHLGYGTGNCLLVGCLSSSTRFLAVCGTLSKTNGSFQIPHPDPAKTQTCELWHSFVESPTAGDNLYRFEVEVENGQATIDLPDYYKHLNEDDQVWVNAKNHFGRAYGVVNQEQTTLTVFADTDGKYNVLLIGTRKDEAAVKAWKGTERLKQN